MLGQLASPDPDSDDVGPAQMTNHREEILWCLLVGEASHGTDYRRTGGMPRARRARSRAPGHARAVPLLTPVNGHADGADPIGRNQPPPDSLDRDPGPDAQRKVGDAAKPPLNGNISAASAARLEFVKGKTMVGVNDPRDGRPVGGHPA